MMLQRQRSADVATSASADRSRSADDAPKRASRRSVALGSFFVLPYVLFLVGFGIGPAIYALLLSFHDPGGGVLSFGLSAYDLAIDDPFFKSAARNVAEFVLLVTPIMLLLVATLAVLLHSR